MIWLERLSSWLKSVNRTRLIRRRLGRESFLKSGECSYSEWIKLNGRKEAINSLDLARTSTTYDSPTVSLVVSCKNPHPFYFTEFLRSVLGQSNKCWYLWICCSVLDKERIQNWMDILSIKDDRIKLIEPHDLNCAVLNDYVGFTRQDDMLHPDALSWMSCAIHCRPSAAIIYADEDQISDSNARMNPDFKPDWSPDFFRSAGYIGPFAVLRKHVILEAHLWDAIDRGLMGSQLIFHAVEEVLDAKCIVHVPQVLYHVRCLPQLQRLGAIQRATSALQAHLDRVFPGALAQHHGEDFSGQPWFRVRYPMPASMPLVSVIIPTRNAKSLVEQCIQSLVEKTTYKNYEIILVDNGSDDPESLQYFESLNGLPNITVVRDDGEFNYSKLNNDAVVKARGYYIVLMNNDIEIIHDDWLDEMISLGSRPGTGVVGAKLLYPDGRVQHAGVIAGLGGVAGHIHRYLESDQAGYQGRAVLTHNLLVVTAACLLVRRSIYESVRGLNDVDLKVAFNDVDFCLRVHQAGYMNVWTPFAKLIHHESATRGLDDHPVKKARFLRECDFMHKTYDDLLKNDPFYNKNCTLNDESFHRSMPTRFSSVAFIDQLSA